MRRVWTWIADRRRWLEAIIVYTILHLLTFVIPQAPTFPKESPAFTRWLAGMRPVFGDRAGTWAEVGLFTLRSSLMMRLTLGAIGVLACVQLATLGERHHEFTTGRRRRTLILGLSGVLVLLGWFAHIQWGWIESGVIAWPDQPVTVRDRELPSIPSNGSVPTWTRYYGLFLVPEGERTGLIIRAFDDEGASLSLLSSVRDEPEAVMRAILTDPSPETFFAVPEAGIIFRLSQWQDQVQVQAYRSASGELLAEVPLSSETPLLIESVTLDVDTQPLSRYRAVYNPGAVFEVVGMLGIIGSLISGRSQPPETDEGSETPEAIENQENAEQLPT
jgi:hypothetical protein